MSEVLRIVGNLLCVWAVCGVVIYSLFIWCERTLRVDEDK